MGSQLRVLRQRIRGVKSIAKITRAQELIASSRITKAQQRVRAATPYDREITRAVSAVVSSEDRIDHPLTVENENPTRAGVLLVTSDRGFCGGYNANVVREAEALNGLLEERGLAEERYVTGRKGLAWHRFRNRPLAREWSGFSDQPTYADAKDVAQTLISAFEDDNGIDEIHIVYTRFVSMLTQEVTVTRILPLEVAEEEVSEEAAAEVPPYFEFEPTAADVLDSLLPRYVEYRIYAAMLQAAASELAYRRRAMKSATDNANELVDVLTREANQARQADITQEISEIVGGANALAEASAGKD